MLPIQFILITSLTVSFLLFVYRFKYKMMMKFVGVAVYIFGVIIVVNPEITLIIANFLGVGRGADLIFYLCFLIFTLFHIMIYSRYKLLKESVTVLVREIAILKSEKMDDIKKNDAIHKI